MTGEDRRCQPQLLILFKLTQMAVGDTKKLGKPTCGKLLARLEELWNKDTLPSPRSFVYRDAVDLRSMDAHPNNVRFDPATAMLVERNDDGTMTSVSEQEIREILAQQADRCRMMQLALREVSGISERGWPD